MENEGNEWDITVWKKVVREKMEEFGLRKWKQGISGKSTVKWYESNMEPLAERIYDGSYCSEFLFKARSQSLEVIARTYRWNSDGCNVCRVCDSGEEKSVYHVIVDCV